MLAGKRSNPEFSRLNRWNDNYGYPGGMKLAIYQPFLFNSHTVVTHPFIFAFLNKCTDYDTWIFTECGYGPDAQISPNKYLLNIDIMNTVYEN